MNAPAPPPVICSNRLPVLADEIQAEHSAALVAELKVRGSGEGFKTLERWLGENDLLFLWRDRQQPLVVLPWRIWERILGKVKP